MYAMGWESNGVAVVLWADFVLRIARNATAHLCLMLLIQFAMTTGGTSDIFWGGVEVVGQSQNVGLLTIRKESHSA